MASSAEIRVRGGATNHQSSQAKQCNHHQAARYECQVNRPIQSKGHL